MNTILSKSARGAVRGRRHKFHALVICLLRASCCFFPLPHLIYFNTKYLHLSGASWPNLFQFMLLPVLNTGLKFLGTSGSTAEKKHGKFIEFIDKLTFHFTQQNEPNLWPLSLTFVIEPKICNKPHGKH